MLSTVLSSDDEDIDSEPSTWFCDLCEGAWLPNEAEGYEFYTAFAKVMGFRGRKDKFRQVIDGMARQRSFVWSNQGRRRLNGPTYNWGDGRSNSMQAEDPSLFMQYNWMTIIVYQAFVLERW